MDIISFNFAMLVMAAALIYYLINNKYRVFYLSVLSGAFIASLDSKYLIDSKLLYYILIYSLINFYIGLKLPDSKNKIALFRIGVAINLSQLIVFKYASFAIDPLLSLVNINYKVSLINQFLIPIGISYFTLQGIGYLFNVKMGWEKPERLFQNFFLYITFFPKFLSGPIERSNHFLPQLKQSINFSEENVVSGLRIVLLGFFKKVVIANQLAPYVINIFNNPGAVQGFELWIVFILLPVYLYFDFSGYTDIAIGFAKVFGIELLPNFNRPFFAENVTTFWKRFHMSLSLWFGDYIFKQTSFRRRKWGPNLASMYAVFLTWILFGIWHGAGWTYMVLGIVQAIAMYYEFFTKRWRTKVFSNLPATLKKWFGRIITYLFYGFSLVIFFSPNLQDVGSYIENMFVVNIEAGQLFSALHSARYYLSNEIIIFVFIFFLIEFLQNDFSIIYDKIERMWFAEKMSSRITRWCTYYIMVFFIYILINRTQEFIYFQF